MPGVQLVVLGKDALAVPGGDDRRADVLGDLPDLLGGVRGDRAAADHHDWPLRAEPQRRGLLDVLRIRPRHAHGPAVGGLGHLDVGRLRLDVHRQVDQHRPPAAAQHLGERSMEHERQLVHPCDVPPGLDDGLHHPREVAPVCPLELLQHGMAAHVGVSAAREHEHRRGVHVGLRHAAGGVDRAGPDRSGNRQRLAGHPVETIRDVRGALLVQHRERLNRSAPVDQRIEQRHVPMSGNADEVRHFLPYQVLSDDFTTGQPHGSKLLPEGTGHSRSRTSPPAGSRAGHRCGC